MASSPTPVAWPHSPSTTPAATVMLNVSYAHPDLEEKRGGEGSTKGDSMEKDKAAGGGGGGKESPSSTRVASPRSPSTAPASLKELFPPSLTLTTGSSLTLTTGSSGSQIWGVDDDPSVTLVGVEELLKVVQFDITIAQAHVEKHNWVELEACVEKFLKDAQIANLIQGKKLEEARSLFNEKVEALGQKDDLYTPDDLEDRVATLSICVKNGIVPNPEDLVAAISDYMKLCFPESLGLKRKCALGDLIATFKDDKGKSIHRCLACQWLLTAPGKVKSHITHAGKGKGRACKRVTRWLRNYIASLHLERCSIGTGKLPLKRKQGFDDIHGESISTPVGDKSATEDLTLSVETPGKKQQRITPHTEEPEVPAHVEDPKFDDIAIPVGSALDITCKLYAVNATALFRVKTFTTAAAVKANGILRKQESLISETKGLIIQHQQINKEIMSKAKVLADLSFEVLPLVLHLPDIAEDLERQAALSFELVHHFFTKAKEQSLAQNALADSSFGTTNTRGASVAGTPGTSASQKA